MRKLANIRIRTVAILLLIVLVLAGLSLILEIQRISGHVHFVGHHWEKFDAERSERARFEDTLASATGFGGFIHNFKNYVLRGDEVYAARARETLGVIFQTIRAYRRLDLSPIDTSALEDMEATFQRYSAVLTMAVRLYDSGASPEAMDAQIHVDDRIALDAFDRLHRQTIHEVTGANSAALGKPILLSHLRIALGYGGLVHCFKDYVLRRDELDLQCAYEKAQDVRDIVQDYRAVGVNQTEEFALRDLLSLIDTFEQTIDLAASFRPMSVTSMPPRDLDSRIVINEMPGVSALATLRRELTREHEERARKVEEALLLLHGEVRLSYWSAVLATIATFAFLAFIFLVLVIRPIARLTDATRRLAEGETGIDVPYVDRSNEVGTMARALTVFKANAERTREAERELADSAATLKRQLTASRAIQETVERQAKEAERLNAVLEAEHQKLESMHAFLDVVMNSLSQGVVVFDRDNRLLRANAAFAALLRLPPNWLDRNRTMEDYIRLSASRGDFGPGIVDEIVRERLGKVADLGSVEWRRYERTLHDGTVLEVFGDRLPDGGLVVTYTDVTERKRAEERIRAMALTDPLTGLANRNQFGLWLDDAIKISRREDLRVGLMLLDLDKFKAVNDTHGHPMGDALLIEVGRRLQRIVREVDTVARLGGDEFAVIFPLVQAKDELGYPASRMVASLTEPIAIGGTILQIGTSIGIGFFPDHAATPEALTKCADEALYAAKAAGRGRFVFCDDLPKPTTAQA